MKTNFHNKSFALSLALKRSQARTRKWPITYVLSLSESNGYPEKKKNTINDSDLIAQVIVLQIYRKKANKMRAARAARLFFAF